MDLIPYKATHPSELIFEELEYRGLDWKYLTKGGSSNSQRKVIKVLAGGDTRMIANLLEEKLGINKSFWVRFQEGYENNTKLILRRDFNV